MAHKKRKNVKMTSCKSLQKKFYNLVIKPFKEILRGLIIEIIVNLIIKSILN